MLLIIDNYDSFTYNLLDQFRQLDIEHRLIKNDACTIDQIIRLKPSSIVLSPGPGRPAQAGVCMELIRVFHNKIPMLGICLGHQAIGEFFGAHLVKARQPVHGKTTRLFLNPHPIWEGIEERPQVMRYHSLVLEGLGGTPLQELALTEDDQTMAICHEKFPLFGMQFHPESILSSGGIKYISNWLKVVNFSPVAHVKSNY